MLQYPFKGPRQDPETLLRISQDQIQYIMHPTIKYAEAIGTYASCDIEAYDCFKRDVVTVVFDVTLDRSLALRMVGREYAPPVRFSQIISKLYHRISRKSGGS